jgi:predicted O-methyltransferase YrrM
VLTLKIALPRDLFDFMPPDVHNETLTTRSDRPPENAAAAGPFQTRTGIAEIREKRRIPCGRGYDRAANSCFNHRKEVIMKRYAHLIFVLCVALIGCTVLPAYSAENEKITAEAREEFIKNFRRTGLNTTVGDAMMLRILVEGGKCNRGVEVGSATGFGAVNMGVGFERTGGHLYTLEIDPRMVSRCRENLKKAGLEKTVTCIEGDALKILPTLEGEFDFVFIDALKRDYLKYLKLLEPKLKPGAIVVADNVIQSEGAMRDFLEYVQTSPNYDTVIIRASMEKNDGMSVSYKIK